MLFDDLIEVSDPEPHDAALNMAIDEALLRTATAPTLRVYRWARPALSFGYFGKWSEAAAAAGERDIVRRWTGGGIVLHGEDVTFSLIIPRGHRFFGFSPRESYAAIHRSVARALPAACLSTETPAPISAACFQNPVEHDILIAGEKVVGGAQRRTKLGLLHQGSIQSTNLVQALAAALAHRITVAPLTTAVLDIAEILRAEKYATKEWTHRA